MKSYSELKRTKNCGEIGLSDIDKKVILNGWIDKYRNLGGLLFLDIRDRYGVTQAVINPEKFDKEMLGDATRTRNEWVVAVKGTVVKRPKENINPKIATGEIDLMVEEFYILSESKTPPFEVTDNCNANESLRLEYRYLDLRRKPLQDQIRIRHEVALEVRNHLSGEGFYEIETPLLLKSTPEGARDYIVPSRVSPGKFYALPQSPQLFKQILMISGFDKYFQIARCLRDEDLRADRQPEHTQIDLEMSFVTPDDVFKVIEKLMANVFKKIIDVEIETPFPRFTYRECMNRWGIDKPDLRFEMELVDLTGFAGECEFKVFKDNVASGGVVKGIVLKGGGGLSRKEIDDLTVFAKERGAFGLAYILNTENEIKSPVKKFLGDRITEEMLASAKAEKGDALFMISDKPVKTEEILGQLRLHLGKKNNLIDKKVWKFMWVTEFPLFYYDEENNSFDAMHNIVSHPLEEDVWLIDEGANSDILYSSREHPWRKAHAAQYDLVINGWEIASGGQRINSSKLQKQILNILGIDNERAERMFGFLLKALDYGAPPHAGIACGFDRLVTLMTGCETIRDVIAFPKTANAVSLMDGSPSEIDQSQLDELGIAIKES